jgi:hypothetical protein
MQSHLLLGLERIPHGFLILFLILFLTAWLVSQISPGAFTAVERFGVRLAGRQRLCIFASCNSDRAAPCLTLGHSDTDSRSP